VGSRRSNQPRVFPAEPNGFIPAFSIVVNANFVPGTILGATGVRGRKSEKRRGAGAILKSGPACPHACTCRKPPLRPIQDVAVVGRGGKLTGVFSSSSFFLQLAAGKRHGAFIGRSAPRGKKTFRNYLIGRNFTDFKHRGTRKGVGGSACSRLSAFGRRPPLRACLSPAAVNRRCHSKCAQH